MMFLDSADVALCFGMFVVTVLLAFLFGFACGDAGATPPERR
jgi:hypothetical protein